MYSSSLLESYARDLAVQIAFYRAVIIIAVILFLIVHIMVAVEVYKRAEEKGHSGRKYAALTLFFPVVGVLLMISLRDERATPQPVQVTVAQQAQSRPQSDELPDL